VRESILSLQRAEARIKAVKNGTDPDLFMIKNLLILKNELVSLEIGDIRAGQDGFASMQHFGQIWETLSPGSLVGYISSFIPGIPWSAAAPVGGKSGTAPAAAGAAARKPGQESEDASEQLDDLLRQSIYAFTRRWGQMLFEARGGSRKLGGKNLVKIERELDETLQAAFANQPEVVGKLKEAIQANILAQGEAKGDKVKK
jgi:conserved oligomeric Golgi complex subunit 3